MYCTHLRGKNQVVWGIFLLSFCDNRISFVFQRIIAAFFFFTCIIIATFLAYRRISWYIFFKIGVVIGVVDCKLSQFALKRTQCSSCF